MKTLSDSELILNSDGSIYHLGLKPEHLTENIITVGDQDRVNMVSEHFDEISFEIQRREFKTIGGRIGDRKITVLSTGIGTDNVDIVFNELAFLANYNLETREPLKVRKNLNLIRLGTSGSIAKEIGLNEIVYSKNAISMDDLFVFYANNFDKIVFDGRKYAVTACSSVLEEKFRRYKSALTITAKGFYGPQFRNSSLLPKYGLEDISIIKFRDNYVGNMEMETAGIYGLSSLLGFNAISINAILADRLSGTFSKSPQKVIKKMILEALEIIQRM